MARFRNRLIAACVSGCLLSIPVPATSSELADAFSGDWRGSGMIRLTPDDAFEAIRCRISADPGGTEDQVTVDGRCASANRTGRFSIDLQQTGDDAVSAAIFVYEQNQTTNFSGRRSGDRMTLASSQPITLGGTRYLLDLTIDLSDGRLTMLEFATPLEGGSRTPILEIDFSQQ